MSPQEWIAFIGKPGAETFAPVYEATKRLVWTLCIRILRNQGDAEDAFQAAYCRILVEARAGSPALQDGEAADAVYRIAVPDAPPLPAWSSEFVGPAPALQKKR